MKHFHFSSLRWRIFAIFWLSILVVVVTIVIGSSLDPRRLHDVPKEYLQKIAQEANDITRRFQSAPNLRRAMGQLQNENRDDGLRYYFADQSGKWLQRIPTQRENILRHFSAITNEATTVQQRLYGRLMVVGPVPVILAEQRVNIYLTLRWREAPPFLLQLLDRPWQMLFAIMFVSTPLLLWLSWAISQPAMRLERAAQKVAKGQFEIDPNLEKGSTEFKQAGESFNQMVQAINNMMQGQQRLLSDISHELRSPLTRLRMANALAMRKQGDSTELARIDTETERLENMINSLLELSRNQANSYEVRQHISCHDIWDDMIQDAQFEAEQLGKSVVVNTLPNCYLTGTPYLLTSAVENVIRNGIKYCKHQVSVTFTVQTEDKQQFLTIQIDDDGKGVEDYELNAIFRPFYRVGEARDRDTGGAGLGLAITQSVMDQHNGKTKAALNDKKGLSILLTLPIERAK